MYTITLADGTKIENLELNGNNFISDTIINDEVFCNNLDTVIISDGEKSETYTDMKLIANQVYKSKLWFILAEKTEEDKKEEAAKDLESFILCYLADIEEQICNIELFGLEG